MLWFENVFLALFTDTHTHMCFRLLHLILWFCIFFLFHDSFMVMKLRRKYTTSASSSTTAATQTQLFMTLRQLWIFSTCLKVKRKSHNKCEERNGRRANERAQVIQKWSADENVKLQVRNGRRPVKMCLQIIHQFNIRRSEHEREKK